MKPKNFEDVLARLREPIKEPAFLGFISTWDINLKLKAIKSTPLINKGSVLPP